MRLGRLGGLGQLWQTLRKLASIMLVCQLLSPLVAFVAICVASTASISTQTVDTTMDMQEQVQILSTTTSPAPVTADDSCCLDDTIPHSCPNDHTPTPLHPQCQDPSVSCSTLPLSCISCNCSYSCKYGATSNASCTAHPKAKCEGARNFTRQFLCSYCYLTDEETHRCSTRDIGCRSVGSPTSKSHWYIANCTTREDTICLGKQVFSKKMECNWTEGCSWKTALILSVSLGGFGADRFYLGHWQEGIGKLFSFGGLGVWTLVDVVLVSTGYIGPADGSLYI
eukprot:GFUD01042035.1.p1 GENE.GFUD01042035.1~~GFUD01042035.1.p1  ORF type:complete len:282 (+),score=77.36 GFUD01042035.1:119-964(+)